MCKHLWSIWQGNLIFGCNGLMQNAKVAAWGPHLMVASGRNSLGWNIPNSFRGSHPQLAEQICKLQTQSGADCVAWNRTTVPRHSFVLWLAARGRLKTNEQLVRRRLTIDALLNGPGYSMKQEELKKRSG
ncbi:hypothetical protein SLEP1_g43682 [Rubroshorea leprosula]|uniref:Reverse transcriptase zinc-binding domain-containing protein n=1 Tax=Rubroshorea leprosula TaxID=152421 RepID=A0AAV5LEA8_9ROSI|nr:hypothetical protein SLEP1_g43682 [Rubroshorea leprosula]